MGVKTTKTNWRVEVYPKTFKGGSSIEETICREIFADIKRHVNGVGSVDIASDSVQSCEYCGRHWYGNTDEANGCCNKDGEEWAVAHPEQAKPSLVDLQ